jgi:hypothetical protein
VPGSKDTKSLIISFGRISSTLNTRPAPPTSSVVMTGMPPPFGKGSCGQLKLPGWGSNGMWVMGGELDFGRTNGLDPAPWPSSIRIYTQSSMSKGVQLGRPGMEPI